MGEPAAFPAPTTTGETWIRSLPVCVKHGVILSVREPAGVEVGQRHRTQLGWEAGVPYRLMGLVATESLGAAEASGVFVSCSPLLDVGED